MFKRTKYCVFRFWSGNYRMLKLPVNIITTLQQQQTHHALIKWPSFSDVIWLFDNNFFKVQLCFFSNLVFLFPFEIKPRWRKTNEEKGSRRISRSYLDSTPPTLNVCSLRFSNVLSDTGPMKI